MTQIYTPAQARELAAKYCSLCGVPQWEWPYLEDGATALRSLADQVEELQTLSVTKILLGVAPGDDLGFEVYPKSVADVEAELYKLGSELEDWQLGIKRHPEMESKIRELQAQLTALRLQKIAEFGELLDRLTTVPVVPAPVARVPPADMLVNGGALQMVLNILRRGTPVQQEAAEELAKTAAPVAQLSGPPEGWKDAV